ncbi:MAG: hypothetical protein LUC29_08980, partial [Acidaminococcaceae bacterium]|nr:hypothetical protein [Acidaminococcaceae bacterium]
FVKIIFQFIIARLCPRKTLTFAVSKTFSSLGAHYASGFKTIGVCAKTVLTIAPKIFTPFF